MDTDDVRMLADLGFVALSRGLDHHAMAIFQGVRAERPEQDAGAVGMALVHLLLGELEPAIKMLRDLGPSDAALTFLGIALARHGEIDEAKRHLRNVASTAQGTSYGQLAADTLASLGEGKTG